jgi:hypothetical protein
MSKPNADTRPLLYAQSQSPSTPSLAPSSTSTSTNANANAANDANTNPPNPKADNNNDDDDDDAEQNPNDSLPPVARPKTPPQSSNHLPWSSYHSLPPDHPVFRYPDAVREKMYAKGVGTLFAPLQPIASIVAQERMFFFFLLTSLTFRPGGQSRNGPRAPGQGVRRAPPSERVLETRDEHDGSVWEYC